jgi:hypothetical protein
MKTETKELSAQIRQFNRWRRGDETLEQPHPAEIGLMLDAAADRLEELELELAVWKHNNKLLATELDYFDETSIEWWSEYQDLKAKAAASKESP